MHVRLVWVDAEGEGEEEDVEEEKEVQEEGEEEELVRKRRSYCHRKQSGDEELERDEKFCEAADEETTVFCHFLFNPLTSLPVQLSFITSCQTGLHHLKFNHSSPLCTHMSFIIPAQLSKDLLVASDWLSSGAGSSGTFCSKHRLTSSYTSLSLSLPLSLAKLLACCLSLFPPLSSIDRSGRDFLPLRLRSGALKDFHDVIGQQAAQLTGSEVHPFEVDSSAALKHVQRAIKMSLTDD